MTQIELQLVHLRHGFLFSAFNTVKDGLISLGFHRLNEDKQLKGYLKK